MNKIIKGSRVKFHSPLPDEDPDQTYIVMEVSRDTDRPRADVKAIKTGLKYPPINTVPLDDIELINQEDK